jgi:fimbrial isopeptide formation D2 family protein
MPARGSLALLPRTRKGLVLFWTALLMLSVALQYGAAAFPQKTLALTGAVFTSNFDGTGIDLNIYDSKGSVYLTGGPCQGGSHLEDGTYYYEVSSPNGVLLSNDAISERLITISGGFITASTGHVTHDVACTSDPAITVQLLPYDTTPNPGGEYKLTVATQSSVEACKDFDAESSTFEICGSADSKTDNYKVGPNGNLKIVKEVDGGEISGEFGVHVDCGTDGKFDRTITFPDPGFVTISNIAAGAECTVTETSMPVAPANFEWGQVTISGKATIEDDSTVTVTVTNHLVHQTGSLKVTKDIPDVPEGFTGSFGIHVTCTSGVTFDRTIAFPDPGFVTIDGIAAGSVCIVIETSKSDPPAGFNWGGSAVGDPVTIVADQTANETVTNLLAEVQGTPVLTVEKSNNAANPASEGANVTYTLTYTLADGPVTLGVLTDKLPAGVTYVAGTATNSSEFLFQGYDAGTRTLTWTAATVTTNGSVTYHATINAGAAALVQPLKNTATIDSEETAPDTATSNVFVAAPPLADTAPPTDIAGTAGDANVSGGSMLFILLALVGLVLTIAFVAPTPAALRKRR